eukprot:11192681-Lingulodinium_polyedra.AAC.1
MCLSAGLEVFWGVDNGRLCLAHPNVIEVLRPPGPFQCRGHGIVASLHLDRLQKEAAFKPDCLRHKE